MPGARISVSDKLTCDCPCWICSLLKASIETGKSKLDCSIRVGVTTIGASRTGSSCAAEIPGLNTSTANQTGFTADWNEIVELRRILRLPLLFSVLSNCYLFYLLSREYRLARQETKKIC